MSDTKQVTKIPVKLLSEIIFADRMNTTIKVLIREKEFEGYIRYSEVYIHGFDSSVLRTMGFELDYTEVLSAYNKVVEARKAEKLNVLKEQRGKEWESKNALAKKLGFELRSTKEEYVSNGSSYYLNMDYYEVYKETDIKISVNTSYSGYHSLTKNVYDYESDYRTKKFKSFDKLPKYFAEMLADCKTHIDAKLTKTVEEKEGLAKVRSIFGDDVQEEIKEEYSQYSGSRSRKYYKTRNYIVSSGERAVRFNPMVVKEGKETWTLKGQGLTGLYTTEEVKQIIRLVKGK